MVTINGHDIHADYNADVNDDCAGEVSVDDNDNDDSDQDDRDENDSDDDRLQQW